MSDILRALAARDWGKRRRITLLRHGAVSYYQADGTPVPSADDVPLNELGRSQAELAIADITLWELALLQERGRLQLPDEVDPAFYVKQLLAALRLVVLPITPEIALLSRSSLFQHGDPADRLIGATALQLGTPLITADARLRALESLDTVW